MRHRKKSRVFSRDKDSRQAFLRGLATNFLLYEKMKTTEARAKEIRPIVEKLITLAKDVTLHHRRQIGSYVYTENALKKIVEVIGPRYKDRSGGYTRIIKVGPRKGDGASMVMIELV